VGVVVKWTASRQLTASRATNVTPSRTTRRPVVAANRIVTIEIVMNGLRKAMDVRKSSRAWAAIVRAALSVAEEAAEVERIASMRGPIVLGGLPRESVTVILASWTRTAASHATTALALRRLRSLHQLQRRIGILAVITVPWGALGRMISNSVLS